MSGKKSKRTPARHSSGIESDKRKRKEKRSAAAEKIADTSALSEPKFGRVIAQFGVNLQIEDDAGELHLCLSRRSVPSLVCGDHVLWCSSDAGTDIVVEQLPRKSLLSRPNYHQQLKPVAANIDYIFIVAAPIPHLDEDLINRYLVATELTDIKPIIVINKMDLFNEDELKLKQAFFQIYRDLGYPLLLVSNKTGDGIKSIQNHIKDNISIFVGQSGVGKSSIIQSLLPDQSLRIGALSASSGLGKHTTSVTVLYPATGGGAVIDSPGVREFGLGHVSPDRIAQGFIEFFPHISQCKFNDCKHEKEPRCAVKEQVKLGNISARRFASFQRIVRTLGHR